MSEAESTSLLVAAARRGDGSALDRLYRRFAPAVHGILLGYVQHADAEDLTQQVFEIAINRLETLRDDAAFPGWLASIARRAALDECRRNTPLTGVDLDTASAGSSPEDRADAEHVLRTIQALPEAYRETMVLRLVEGLTGPEIAERIGLTPGSVRVNLHRGMAQLRKALVAREQGL